MRISLVLVAALSIGVAAGVARAAGQAPPSGVLSITVVDGQSGRALPGATVILRGQLKSQTLGTDSTGTTEVKGVPAGTYALQATAPGYVTGGYGATEPPSASMPLELGADPRAYRVRINLWRTAAIRGVVRNGAGAPMADTTISVWRARPANGVMRFFETTSRFDKTTTDAQGTFALTDLEPGTFLLAATTGTTPAASARNGYATVTRFFPDQDSPALAQPIALRSGEERFLDVGAPPAAGVSVWGRLTTVVRGRVPEVRLVIEGETHDDVRVASARVSPSGTFELHHVPPGRYILKATDHARLGTKGRAFTLPSGTSVVAGGRGRGRGVNLDADRLDESFWVRMPIEVGAVAIERLEVPLQAGRHIRGSLSLVGHPSQSSTATVQVLAADTPLEPIPIASVAPDGTFESVGLAPGRYQLVPSLAGWQVTALSYEGRSVLGQTIQVSDADIGGVVAEMRSGPTGISGTVRTRGGVPAPGTAVLVFPEAAAERRTLGPRPHRVVSTGTSPTGAFRLRVPPGRYLIVAQDAVPPDWPTITGFSRLTAGATRIAVPATGHVSADLTVR